MSPVPGSSQDSEPVECLRQEGQATSGPDVPAVLGPLAPLRLDRAQRPTLASSFHPGPACPGPRSALPLLLVSPWVVHFATLCLSFHICKGGPVPVLVSQVHCAPQRGKWWWRDRPASTHPCPRERPLGRVSLCLSFPICSSTPTAPRAFWGSPQIASPSPAMGGGVEVCRSPRPRAEQTWFVY